MSISRFSQYFSILPRQFVRRKFLTTDNVSGKCVLCNVRSIHVGKSNSQKPTFQKPGTSYNSPSPKTIRNYVLAVGVLTLGLSYAAVPLYYIFCQSTGYGGTVKHDVGGEKIEKMKKDKNRLIKVTFNSDVSAKLKWRFRPQQTEIKVYPGETALAFYKAQNSTDKPIIGISTYNILPFEAGPYFNKIQCFCFEEQQLNPHEEVDMPVFFYIDPEFCEDPKMEHVNEIVLSYTFFEAKSGMTLPFMNTQATV